MDDDTDKIIIVVTVDNSTARITGTGLFIGQQEGEDGFGNTIVFAEDPIPADFEENYYYDFNAKDFVKGPERPHQFVDWDLATLSWVPDEDSYLQVADRERLRLLYLTDWCFAGDIVEDDILDPADMALARTYRQELRDFLDTITDFTIPIDQQNWPVIPPFLLGDGSTRRINNIRSYF